jgi:hypothetical protein
MIDPGYAKGGEIVSKLAKLAALLKGAPSEIEHSVAPLAEETGKAFTPTGRAIPRDDEYERLQSLVTNQPTEAGHYQWAVVKPNGKVHGAPFDFKGSALRIADGLNESLPGHTVQALSVDAPEIARYVPRPDINANPFKKATAEDIDAMLSQGDKPQMAKGGEIFSKLRQLAEQLGDKTATVSNIADARNNRDLQGFHSQLMQNVRNRMDQKQDIIGSLNHQFRPGDIVGSQHEGFGPYRVLGLDATQYYPEDAAAIKAGQKPASIAERKQRPHIPAYLVEGPDGSRFTMAEWGMKGKFGGPRGIPTSEQTVLGNAPLTNEDASIFERNGARGLGEQMEHAESHDADARVMQDLTKPPPDKMAEGGEVEFDPIESARERAYGSSSPGSPGISGAIKDAINALRSYLLTPAQNQVAEDKRRAIDSQVEDHADGGTVEGPSTEHEQKAGLGKRFGMRVAEQAYGLDANGQPVLGGRAWTKTQGGTPMGILDEITAVPHSLLSLAHTTRSLDPLRKYFPDSQGLEDKLFESIDPQWSKDASDRLERLRAAMNSRFGIGEAHSIPEHMTDAAASLVSPIPMAKEGEQANLARRVLEMTTPLRPRTVKNFATDTAVLGGLGTGIDALTDRLSRLRAQAGSQGGGAPVDPANFSRDMGLSEDRPVSNSHQMVPMVTEHGDIYYGVDPETL